MLPLQPGSVSGTEFFKSTKMVCFFLIILCRRVGSLIPFASFLPPPPPIFQPEPGPRPWGCALGQSFGGFCMMTYLSLIDHPPRICLLTGGIAPMLTPVYRAYYSLWDRVKERSLRYYETYPGDIPLVKKIVSKLIENPPALPSGGKLTARRFLQLGMSLGGSPSSFASMHDLLNSAFLHPNQTQFSRSS